MRRLFPQRGRSIALWARTGFTPFLIPPAVAREIARSIPVLPHWASVRAPIGQPSMLSFQGQLGDGEREAIALAVEVGADAIVLDDRPARRVAGRRD
ncbi:MAG: hypothetical protein ACRD15_05595 [Vicinamibacterales bacterium]